jgi:NTE family protein
MTTKLTIGLALGSGSSRGWAHIGILAALAERGIHPDVVCGTSIGALVGASYVAGNINKLEAWTRSLTRLETAKFFEINVSLRGFVDTERFSQFINEYVAGDALRIDDVDKRFAAVATDLSTGREVWFTDGSMVEAVWASISLPGLFPAIRCNERWLVDGGLVNPVPVSVCRALGADVVIAVNLNGDIVGKHLKHTRPEPRREQSIGGRITDLVREYTDAFFPESRGSELPPGLFDAIASAINITQDRITRSRMAGDPPDFLLSPRLSHIGLLEFFRADEAIEEGRRCAEKIVPEMMRLLGSE